jgi:hypothetical protein
MLVEKYLLLFGLGLLSIVTANVLKNFHQVVQYHRRLRPIAPGVFFSFSSGLKGACAGSHLTHGVLAGIATELDDCPMDVSCGLAAADSCCRHSGGAQRKKQRRVARPQERVPAFL